MPFASYSLPVATGLLVVLLSFAKQFAEGAVHSATAVQVSG